LATAMTQVKLCLSFAARQPQAYMWRPKAQVLLHYA
jgi:hypothetical protein